MRNHQSRILRKANHKGAQIACQVKQPQRPQVKPPHVDEVVGAQEE